MVGAAYHLGKHSLEKPPSKRFKDADSPHNLIVPYIDLAPCECFGIVRLLDIIRVDDSHLVRQKVPLLKHAASAFPVFRCKRIGKVESESFLHPSPRAAEVLKVNIGRLLPAHFPSKAVERGDKVIQCVSDQVIFQSIVS